MYFVTIKQYVNAIEAFNDLLIEHLDTTDGTQFKILTNYVKWVSENPYIFSSLQVAEAVIDFTISYSEIYMSPVLHFRLYNEGKLTFDLDNLVELKSLFMIRNVKAIQLDTHVLLGSTWFVLHPCETLRHMDELMSVSIDSPDLDQNQVMQYLISWFNTYGLSGVFSSFDLRIPKSTAVPTNA